MCRIRNNLYVQCLTHMFRRTQRKKGGQVLHLMPCFEVCKSQLLFFCAWEGFELHLWHNTMHRSSQNDVLYQSSFSGNEYSRYKCKTNVGLFFGNMNGT